MKKFLIFFAILFITPVVCADESLLDLCHKNYPLRADDLYILTLSALNGTGQFDVIEMQSKSGYIVFMAASKEYVATVSKIGPAASNIKILPSNSNFSNGSAIQKAIFDTLDQNIQNIPKQVL